MLTLKVFVTGGRRGESGYNILKLFEKFFSW